MPNEEENKTSMTIFRTPSLGVLGVAFLLMLFAKCFGYCPDLPWWIVTCPLWGPWALCIAFFALFYAFAIVIGGIYLAVASIIGLCLWIGSLFEKKDNNDHELHC